MMKNLPGEQVILLEKAFKKAQKRREIFRLQALLLLTQGYKRKEVTGMVRVSLCALGNWVSKFKKHGVGGLCDKNQPGNHRKLTVLQKHELKTLITTQTPDQLNLEDKFWTPKLVSQLIRSKYQVSYLQEASRRLLHQFGLSFHKPKKVNQRQSEHMRERFEETLKKRLKDWSNRENTVVLVEDEAKVQRESSLKAIWFEKGQHPTIRVDQERQAQSFSQSFYGALDVKEGKCHLWDIAGKQNSQNTVKFITQLEDYYQGKDVLLIWDGAPSHWGEVKTYLKQLHQQRRTYHKRRWKLQIMYFPPYWPKLNPQEGIWKQGK